MNTKLSGAGFAIQTDQGAAAAAPAFYGPVGGGKLVTVDISQEQDELTASSLGAGGELRRAAAIAADYEARAWHASIIGYLYAVLGAITSTGTTAPYTHNVFADDEVPWCTVFGNKDTDRKAASDCKCDELKIEWEGNGPLKVNPTWAGLGVSYGSAKYVPVLDEEDKEYFTGIHLATTLDIDGSGYDGDAKILGGSLDIKRNLTADEESGKYLPGDLHEGDLEIDYELKCRVPDLLPVRLIVTGAVDGASPSAEVPYGDVTLLFTQDSETLTIASTKVAWQTEEPESDPKGGPGEITLKGRAYSVTPISVTGVNSHKTY